MINCSDYKDGVGKGGYCNNNQHDCYCCIDCSCAGWCPEPNKCTTPDGKLEVE